MVTLEITDTRINLLLLRGRQVEVAASCPLEPGLVKDGIIVDTMAAGQLLREVMDSYGVAEKQAIVGISGMHSIYRTFNLPRLPSGMLGEAVKREIARVLPVPESEVYTSWQAIDISGTETLICLVALPRTSVDAATETLHMAGLESRIMDVSPLALARVADESNAMVINAHQDSFDIVVMIDGIPRLLRSLSTPPSVMPASDVQTTLLEEIDRTMAFLDLSREVYPRATGLPIFLAGQSRQMIVGALSEHLVRPLPHWFYLTEGLDVGDYAVNIGLALKQIKVGRVQSRVDINVVPEAYRPKPIPIMAVVSWALIIIAAASIIPAGMSTVKAISETKALQAQLNTLQQQVETATGTAASLAKLRTKFDQANAKLVILKQPMANAQTQRAGVNEKLAKATSLKPGNVEVTSISYATTLSVSGTAPDKALVLHYASALRDSGKFSSVIVQQLTEVEFNEWSFTILMK
jgi:type IV pilus assembly protein PilM